MKLSNKNVTSEITFRIKWAQKMFKYSFPIYLVDTVRIEDNVITYSYMKDNEIQRTCKCWKIFVALKLCWHKRNKDL